MSADSAVSYTSIHSEAQSWSIPSEDPYEEAAQQLLEHAPCSPEYVLDPIELEDHVPAHIPDHPEDLVPAEDEAPIEAYIPEVASAPTPSLPPSFLSPRIRPPHTIAAMAQMRAAVPSTYHSLLPSGTPPLLPMPLHVRSTSRRAEILKAGYCFPRPGSDSAVTYSSVHSETRSWSITSEDPFEEAAQQLFEQAPHSSEYVPRDHVPVFIPELEHPGDLVPAEDTERRMMAAFELVNRRKDRATVRAEIKVLRNERLAYEQEGIQTREALARSEAHCRALEARVAVLETHMHRLEWQRQAADDFAIEHFMRTQALEAGARNDTLEDAGSSS
nr:hypothetical protein [Tanacetum cinerariifolium]